MSKTFSKNYFLSLRATEHFRSSLAAFAKLRLHESAQFLTALQGGAQNQEELNDND